MNNSEICLIISDSIRAVKLYKNIFDVENIEATDLDKGLNEVSFSLNGLYFHMLDENSQYGMFAPKEDDNKSIWFNIVVDDISVIIDKAVNNGCKIIQPPTKVLNDKFISAMFSDEFGYIWQLHQKII